MDLFFLGFAVDKINVLHKKRKHLIFHSLEIFALWETQKESKNCLLKDNIRLRESVAESTHIIGKASEKKTGKIAL